MRICILQGSSSALIDIVPVSLGVEVWDTGFIPVLKRLTFIPSRETKLFTTSIDNQTSVKVRILEGDRCRADDNVEIGCFEFAGIASRAWGIARIAITFDLRSDDELVVSVNDLDSDRKQGFTCKPFRTSSKFDDQIDKTEAYMVNERETGWSDLAEQTTIFLYFTENVLHETGHRFDQEKIKTIQLHISELQETIRSLSGSKDALERKEKYVVVKRKRKQLEMELFLLSPTIFQQIEFKYAKNGPREAVIYGLPPWKPRLMLPMFESICGRIQK